MAALFGVARLAAPRNFTSSITFFPLSFQHGNIAMTVNLVTLQPLVALVAGVLILLMPRLLNYIVAVYLIVIGITGLIR
jgi:hypothetical protein